LPTQQFEGPTLEAALTKVRAELGPDARITGAETVRSGGLGGFFAKERVEVTVEVPDAPTDAATAATPSVPAAPTMTSMASAPVSTEAAPVTTPMSILDLADSISDVEQDVAAAAIPEPHVSTESASFASVLRRIAGEADMAVAAQTAGDDSQRESSLLDERLGAAPMADDADGAAPPAAAFSGPNSKALAAFTALARRTTPAEATADDDVAPSEDTAPADDGNAAGSNMEITAEIGEELIDDDAVSLPVMSAPAIHVPSMALRVPSMALHRLGLPGALMPMSDEEDLYAALVDALARLPHVAPLPSTRGTVMAIVGKHDEALAVARQLAVETRTDRREIVLCGPTHDGATANGLLHLATADEAEEHRRSWRRRLRPTLVVVDAPISGSEQLWTNDVIGALEPHSVWGVADAGRKLEDVAVWVDEVGGIDALAVAGLDATTTPAAILQLGLPVAMVDGELACPELWADILMDRLAA
jgi:flagellar biosynthesis GTPase FlhF